MARRVVSLLALLAVLGLSGCTSDKETPDPSDKLVVAYDHTAGADQVHVESGVDAQGAEFVDTVVDLDADASDDQIDDIVLGHADKVTEAGFPTGPSYRGLRFTYGDGEPTLALHWTGTTDEDAVRSGVADWRTVSEVVGPSTALVLGSDGSRLYGATPEPGDTAVGDVFRSLAQVPDAGSATWDVRTEIDGVAERFAINGLPTAAELKAWDTLVSTLGSLPRDLSPSELEALVSDRAEVRLVITAPEGTTKSSFKQTAYGALLWPTFQAQLDAVPGLDRDWGYSVDWATEANPDERTPLIALASDTRPVQRQGTTSAWSRAAYAYLHPAPRKHLHPAPRKH